MITDVLFCFFFFKQKTAYEMRISDWSSDVCSSDLACAALGDLHIPFSAAWQVFVTCALPRAIRQTAACYGDLAALPPLCRGALVSLVYNRGTDLRGGRRREMRAIKHHIVDGRLDLVAAEFRSEEHTSELQSLMRNSYAVF